MYEIDKTFEEVSLCIGKDRNGKRQTIATISGSAVINVLGKRRWEYDSVTLLSPIAGDPDTTIDVRHPLFEAVCASLDHAYADQISDETVEVMQPDPDHRRELLSAD